MPYDYTRKILIGGVDFSNVVSTCTFSVKKDIGNDSASLTIATVAFDDTSGINPGDEVLIKFSDAATWWVGIVTDMDTSLTGGINLQCAGYGSTLLAETIVSGLFGDEVFPPHATNIVADVIEGGHIGEGYHKYIITALDDRGERASSDDLDRWYIEEGEGLEAQIPSYSAITVECQVDYAAEGFTSAAVRITWDRHDKPTGWRVYKQLSSAQQSAEAGEGNATSQMGTTPDTVDALWYVDVSDPEFVDDGTIDWVNETEVAMPRYDTCRYPSIFSTGSPYSGGEGNVSARACVRHLVSTYFADGYSMTKLEVGEDTRLDDVDFNEEEVSLADALQMIADIVGNVAWGVDNAGDVYFKERKTPANDAEVVKAFVLGSVFDWAEVHDSGEPVTDVLLDCVRSISRDGATNVQVEAAESVKTETSAKKYIAEKAYPSNVAVAYYDQRITGSDREFRGNVARMNLPAGSTPITAATESAWLSSFATHSAFRAAFPGMAWYYRLKELATGDWPAWRERTFTAFKNVFHADQAPGVQGGVRKRGVLLPMKPLRSEKLAVRAAANIAQEHKPVVGRWRLSITNAATLFVPGVDLVSVTTASGQVYVMQVLSASYTFAETVQVSLECGEPDIVVREEKSRTRLLASIVDRQGGIDAGFAKNIRRLSSPGSVPNRRLLAATPGTSLVPASIDHTHNNDPNVLNRLLLKDGTAHPSVQRKFVAADIGQLDDFATPATADYKRGLQFTVGDSAVIAEADGRSRFMRRRMSMPAAHSVSTEDEYQWHESVEVFTVVDEKDDYLECTDSQGNDVNVAKPYELQNAPFDGETRTFFSAPTSVTFAKVSARSRVATFLNDDDDEIEETQVITPAYIDGGKVYATYVDTGITDDDGKPIYWIDNNVAGRQWGVY